MAMVTTADRSESGRRTPRRNGRMAAFNKAMFRGLMAATFQDQKPAATGLPGFDVVRNRKNPFDCFIPQQNLFHSVPEESLDYFIRGQLLPDVDLKYAETAYPGNQSDDIAPTWGGLMTHWTRDFDITTDGFEFQLQVKRTNLREKLFWSIGGEHSKYILLRYYPKLFHQKRKAFRSLRKSLLTFALRYACNALQCQYANDQVRMLMHVSASSAKAWKARGNRLKDSDQLFDLFCAEQKKFADYYWDFLKAVFPEENSIFFHAGKLFKEKYDPKTFDGDSLSVALKFADCLDEIKKQRSYDASDYAVFKRWHSMEIEDVVNRLPKKFKKTDLKDFLSERNNH
jgi:hypothetical protein